MQHPILSRHFLDYQETINLQESILSKHHLDYQEIINKNNKLISTNLSDLEIKNLYNKKYSLSEFDIYKYITAYDYIRDSLNSSITLTEGIYKPSNKYNNILLDLFFQNISSELVHDLPISVVFGIKQKGRYITEITNWDKYMLSLNRDTDDLSYIFNSDLKFYKSRYKSYGGNSYTYYMFKQLLKLLLTEVYLYKYHGRIFTFKELTGYYLQSQSLFNHPDPRNIKSLSQLIDMKKIEKIQYQCIKVSDPSDIQYESISNLKLYLIDINKNSNYIDSYDSLIEK